MNIVAVKFKGYKTTQGVGQEYHYLTDLNLTIGDNVVVESPSEGYVVVIVTKICGPLEGTKATKWIVQKVDDTEYKRKEEARRRKSVIETKLRAIEKQLESTMKFEYLAKMSPEAARLLEELREIR